MAFNNDFGYRDMQWWTLPASFLIFAFIMFLLREFQ
jgi:hypothetical protein